MKVDEIIKALDKANEATFDIDRSPANWVAQNRVKFNTWLDKTFKYTAASSSKEKCSNNNVKVDTVNLFPHQKFIKDYIQFNSPYRGILLYHGLGVGKCHARDTPIMMYDGRIKKVQDVQVGDLLMGDDSTPRTVLCLNQGNDDLYKIIPTNLDDFSPFIVNNEHILCLRHRYSADKISEISMRNYIKCSQEIKEMLLQYRTSVEFPHVDTPNDPYQQGINGQVHDVYIYNSEKVRLEFLAGLIDSADYGSVIPLHNCYALSDLPNESDLLKLKYMAHSLGMSTIITNHKLMIYGKNADKIKLRIRTPLKDNLYMYDGTSTEFMVSSIGRGDYYGFAVDGNHRYLLGDFTVTHNSCASIAAAELLMNHMNVVVMTPASLRNNYIGEIKKCGRRFYNTKQHWKFIPLKTSADIDKIAKASFISETLLQSHKGIWLPNSEQTSNYPTLPNNDREQIMTQIDNIINNRYTFINYNGLNTKSIKKLTEDGNPFDNKCIVIDEIHNLISRIVNKGLVGSALYKLLMSAKNCKLILLSGTPIINYPYEIAYLINLITGPKLEYTLSISKPKREHVENTCANIMTIERYEMIKNKLKISFLPRNFEYVDEERVDIRSGSAASTIEHVIDILTKAGISVDKTFETKEYKSLPEKEDEFNKYFVNMEESKIENVRLFSRRILGTISHYSTYSPELYPSVETIEWYEELTPFQFKVYQKSRSEERKKEQTYMKPSDNIFKDTGQVYRFYSRANCNFVFPKDIARPFPGLKEIASEIDDDDALVAKMAKDATDTKSKMYDAAVQKALDNLAKENYLHLDNLGTYSPKFKQIIQRCNDLDGTALIYSQFRRVEGLGILALALKANGYAEFKIHKVDGEYEIVEYEDDEDKPRYIIFTGNNEETQILLKVFNSDFDNLPPKIKAKLTGTNIRGNIIKILMITQSGAEGLSLKNVRQVHIVEPYWNYVRIDQVVGRAVRTCSHVSLPPKDRNVTVYIYNMVFSKEQLTDDFSMRVADKSMTSDEYIYNLAKRKAKIIKMLYDAIKTSSIDCVKFSSGALKCFSFPVNMDESRFTYPNDINKDVFDMQYEQEVEINEWKGQVMITKKGNFLVRSDTHEVYDYDIYLNSSKLVKIGVLRLVNNQKQIVKS
jgi:hypothetical protein